MLKYYDGLKIGAKNTRLADIVPFRFVDVDNTNGNFEIAIGASGSRRVGVILDECKIGDFQTVLITGIAQVLASGTVTKGDSIEVDTGKAKTSTVAEKFVGVALSTGTDVLVDVLLK